MKMLFFHLLILGVQPKPAETEPLHGTWLFKSGTVNGEAIKFPERMMWRFTFGNRNKLLIRKTAEPDRFGAFAVTSASKEIDVTLPGENGEITSAGIYRMEGESLTLALLLAEPRKRPTNFDPKQKILLLTFQKQKPSPADEVPAKLNVPPAQKPLSGRWELLIEEKVKGGGAERTEIEILLEKKSLVLRRNTTTPLIGELNLDGKTETRLTLIPNPEGRKDAFGIVENFIEGKKEVTFRFIQFNFQGEVLELAGEVRPAGFGAINFTGQWKRVPDKK